MKEQHVSINPVIEDLSSGLSEQVICTCSFCGKSSKHPSVSRSMCEKISLPRDFFCQFCIRHKHYTRNARHKLILTFRGIIGWYYWVGYKKPPVVTKRTLYLAQIHDFIKEHEKAGLIHPAFSYDPESWLWFVDFEIIGKARRKLSVDTVHETITSILASFNLWEVVPNIRMQKVYAKYEEAINAFYEHRIRPADRRILAPTLSGCGVLENKDCSFEKTREFNPTQLIP